MSINQPRILIFGAGVIGSIYAIKFIQAGFDVTLLARSTRFKNLKEEGLLYHHDGEVKSIKIPVIDRLERNDVYDVIFVALRYDKAQSALQALKDNQSNTIVTMISLSTDFTPWLAIIGNRLLPAFPGVGGQIKEGVLFPRIPPKALASTVFGEMDGSMTKRIASLSSLFDAAKLPFTINIDMKDYLITHSVSDIAMLGALAPEDRGLTPWKKAKKITDTLKKYLRAIEQAGIIINPKAFKWALKLPNWLLNGLFTLWLRTNMVKDMGLPAYATSASNEIRHLEDDLLLFLAQQQTVA